MNYRGSYRHLLKNSEAALLAAIEIQEPNPSGAIWPPWRGSPNCRLSIKSQKHLYYRRFHRRSGWALYAI